MNYAERAQAAADARQKVWDQHKALVDSINEAKREATAEESASLAAMAADMDAKLAEGRAYVASAKREDETREFDAEIAGMRTASAATATVDPEAKLAEDFRLLAKGEIRDLSVDFRTATSGTAGNAGNTKPTTFIAQVIAAMVHRSEFFGMPRLLNTAGGELLEFPVKGALPVGVQIAENTAYTKVDTAWTKANLGAWKYGVIAEATMEIVDDSALPILEILADTIGTAIADKVVLDLLVGVGTTKPWGFVTRSAGAVNAATYTAVTSDNLMDLQYALLTPYRKNGVYIISDALAAVVRKLKDTTGRYLWEPSMVAGQPDRLHGYPVVIDPNIATAGAGAKVGVFGDPTKYLIRQVKDLRVVRSDEYGFDRDVVAFKASWRGDGDLLDVSASYAITVTA